MCLAALATTGYSVDNSGVLILPTIASTLPLWVSLANLVQQIQAQAADQVQSDWNETITGNAAFILNKPAIINPVRTAAAGAGGIAVTWTPSTETMTIDGTAVASNLEMRVAALEAA